MEPQSIFAKYAIWHTRLACINKLCCGNYPVPILNRLQKIQWTLICSVNEIENGQRKALEILGRKKFELLLIKDENGRYVNNPNEWINSNLLDIVNEIEPQYADWKEIMNFAYDLVKL